MNFHYNKLYDISMPITESMPVYKGRASKRPIMKIDSDFTTGSAYESRIDINMHTGTHIDRTLHMIPEGNTVETLDLGRMLTNCKVFDLTQVTDHITAADLESKDIEEGDFVLLKTRNSYEDILEGDFVYLDQSGSALLKDKKVKGVGIDGLGIERSQPEHETHLQLMHGDIIILEGLRLKDVEEGSYYLLAVPLNIVGAEAAPVRAILLQ